jgi:hypothetical protein
MGAKALLNAHPKSPSGAKGGRRCRVCGMMYSYDYNQYLIYSIYCSKSFRHHSEISFEHLPAVLSRESAGHWIRQGLMISLLNIVMIDTHFPIYISTIKYA